MIKLFRKIRQKLLVKNSFKKYFLYAIGEIILVVIGILIALQVNNWNSNRLEQKNMNSILEAIKLDLQTDIKETTRLNKFNQTYLNFRRQILMLKNFDTLPLDTLTLIMRKRTSQYTLNLAAFNKLTNQGFTKLSKNDTLNKKLYHYYSVIKEKSEEMNNWERNSTSQEYENLLSLGNIEIDAKHYNITEMENIPTFQDSISLRDNIIKVITSIDGRNLLKSEVFRKIRLIYFFDNRNQFATDLISEIDKELSN
ncbi:DUF6090 family protein [Litoribaculum gwangyangense]|uniref:Uncharacterized protein n=1 Tax=Litoribaculum gwangyangense TaxID=1130722 RepID=A0ABP9CQR3_9FLAO